MTMAAESAPPEQMATAIGWVQTAQRLGPAIGPVLGGLLVQTVGLRLGFLVAAAVYLAAVFLVIAVVHEPRDRRAGPSLAAPVVWTSAAIGRIVPQFTLYLGVVLGLQLVDRSFGPILPLYLRETGTPAERVPFLSGVLFTVMAGAAAIGNQVTGWCLDRRRVGTVVTLAAASAAVGAAAFGLGARMSVLGAMAVVFGLGIGIATTAIYTAAGRAVAAPERGLAFAYLTTAYLVGLAVSPVVAGLIGAASMRAVFIVDAAGLAAIAWVGARRIRA